MEDEKIMAKGKLTTFIVMIILSSLAFISMFLFYADTVNEYSSTLNFTTSDDYNKTFRKLNETLDTMGGDMTATHRDYVNINKTGTTTTASDKMILNGFKVIKSVMKTTGTIATEIIPDTAKKLFIPYFWVTGFVAIILAVIVIIVVSGLFRITTW